MRLKAMVTRSVFGDLLKQLKKGEIDHIRRAWSDLMGNDFLTILATISTDKLLEIAGQVQATTERPELDLDSKYNSLTIESHGQLADNIYSSFQDQLCIWTDRNEREF